MPCIWGQHNGAQLFLVVVILPANSATLTAAPHGATYNGPLHPAQALVDTGATITAISKRLAGALGIQPIGKTPVHGAGGLVNQNQYLFHVGFPFAMMGQPTLPGLPAPQPGQVTVNAQVLQKVIQGVEFNNASAPFDVLLGMDVISSGSLVVQGGQSSFSFSF
jgi:hypothetical protein